MIRYIKQKDKSSCVPVAIVNAKKWLGVKPGKDYIKHIKDDYGYISRGKHRGMSEKTVINAVCGELEGSILSIKVRPTLRDLDRSLKRGNIAMIVYYIRNKSMGGHATLCVNRTNKYYRMINDGKTNILRHRKTLSTLLSNKSPMGDCSFMIEIRRNK